MGKNVLHEFLQGRNVAIEQGYGAPKITKDGVTVAKVLSVLFLPMQTDPCTPCPPRRPSSFPRSTRTSGRSSCALSRAKRTTYVCSHLFVTTSSVRETIVCLQVAGAIENYTHQYDLQQNHKLSRRAIKCVSGDGAKPEAMFYKH